MSDAWETWDQCQLDRRAGSGVRCRMGLPNSFLAVAVAPALTTDVAEGAGVVPGQGHQGCAFEQAVAGGAGAQLDFVGVALWAG